MTADFDEGPKIDIGQDSAESELQGDSKSAPQPIAPAKGGGGGGAAGWTALVLSVIALLLAGFSVARGPEPAPVPPISPDVVPGGTGERVAKLEKDASQLILRMVTLEKELHALGNRAGSIAKLAELSAKVAALQDRLDAMALESRMAALANQKSPSPKKTNSPQAKPKAAEKKAPPPKAAPAPQKAQKPKAKKLVYTVRRGDTLFTVARRYKVSMSSLMKWNRLKKGYVLKIGDKLTIYK